jgi:hypothetical protein
VPHSRHHQNRELQPEVQNVAALSVKLTPEEMAELESFASVDAVQGDRYHGNYLKTWKDSETPPMSSWKAT